MIARAVLRDKYVTADVGITGANFAVAETGMISITENEGNARLTAALPQTLITLMGIEKVVPKLSDLALFLPMLATAGAGQAMTGYNSMYGGPRQPGECDGPEEYHVVLLDNARTHLLADGEQRDALHCIRCGACLNVCPIYRNVGGHTYGTTYSGPIGSVITPHLRGLQQWKHLSQASSLCGACTEACPVKIDLHHHLLQNRRNAVSRQPVWWEKLAFRAFAFRGGQAGARSGADARLPGSARNGFTRWSSAGRSTRRGPGPRRATCPLRAKNLCRSLAREKAAPGEGARAMNGEKEKILRRIREALAVPAPYPGSHGEQGHEVTTTSART